MSLVKHEHRSAWPLESSWTDERIDRMFRAMFRDVFSGAPLVGRWLDVPTTSMQIEEYVEDGTCIIRAELPGIDPDKDVEITVVDGLLHLAAHRQERSEEKRRNGYRSEFRYGMFERHLRLPEGATDADVSATYKDGILEVRVPIPAATEEPAVTKVPVKTS
jgi:HSP20 family protein